MAVNKSYIKNLTGLSFQVEVKDEASGSTIRDILGGFSGGAFEDKVFMNKTTFDPKFFTQGCMGFSNATACINNSVGTKCKWDSDFNKCWPDMFGETSGSSAYSCSDMCGACNNQTDCTAQTECQWNANIFNPKEKKYVQAKIKTFVDSGQLGPFANAYWGHPAYKLPPEANLMAAAHYLEALDWQREVIKIQA